MRGDRKAKTDRSRIAGLLNCIVGVRNNLSLTIDFEWMAGHQGYDTEDWRGLIHYGVIFFMLEKLGAVVGTTNLHIYAAMKGMTLEDFQKTRNAQVLYSVAGKDEGKKDWDTAKS